MCRKYETHNHPTEIEPFGGAATCLGGAIRDPLSGRTYVYQAMRVTGAADPTVPVENTMRGKLSIAGIGIFTDHARPGRSSHDRTDLHSLCHIVRMIHLFYKPEKVQ